MRYDSRMSDWKAVIIGIEYLLMFKKTPSDYVDTMHDAILKRRGISFSREEVLEAISILKSTDIDISTLLPQPHSNKVLRDFFYKFEEKLNQHKENH